MLSKHLVVKLTVLGSVLGLFLGPFSPGMPAAQASCGRPSGCTAFELVHAGASYDWYPVKHRYEFIGGRAEPKEWHLAGDGKLYQQNGMLTLVAKKGRHDDVRTIWKGVGYEKGRWEVRMRTARESHGATDYRVVVSLVPSRKKERHCGGQDIDLLSYDPAHPHRARLNINTLPDNRFTFSKELSRKVGSDEWHEFAVEVGKDHISWFVDAHVVATEKRPAALSGTSYTLQAALVAEPGRKMNKTRLQLDWARYWTMRKKSSKSLKAPRTELKRNAAAC